MVAETCDMLCNHVLRMFMNFPTQTQEDDDASSYFEV